VNHMCSFDFKELDRLGGLPREPVGCMDGYFWNWGKNNCTPCAYGCLRCEGNENRCISCANGRYLSEGNKCELCESFWKGAMMKGSSGACLE
jgi:hypothetical protein